MPRELSLLLRRAPGPLAEFFGRRLGLAAAWSSWDEPQPLGHLAARPPLPTKPTAPLDCPVCGAVLDRVQGVLRDLDQAGRLSDPGCTLCLEHLRALVTVVGDSARRLVAGRLVRDALSMVEQALAGMPGAESPACLACKAAGQAEEACMDAFGEAVSSGPTPAADSERCCVRHWIELLRRVDRPAQDRLIERRARALDQLDAELAEFFGKSDYRFAHEPKGQEQTAWRRTLALFAGVEGPGPTLSQDGGARE